MSFTDAPTPNTPEAKEAMWRGGVKEDLARLERSQTTPHPIPIPMTGGQLASGFVFTNPGAATTFVNPYIGTRFNWPAYDCVVVRLTAAAGAANIEIRLSELNSGATTSVAVVTAGLTRDVQFEWIHELSTDYASASEFRLAIQFRRVSAAAGDASVFKPDKALFLPSQLVDGAATNGAPTIL